MKIRFLLISIGFILTMQNCNANDPNYQYLLSIPGLQTSTPEVSTPDNTTTTNFTLGVTDVTGDPNFIFDTTRTITFLIAVVDPQNANLAGNQVKIIDTLNNSTIFRAITSNSGNVSGSFTINNTSKVVQVTMIYGGIPYQFSVDLSSVQDFTRVIYINGAANVTLAPVVQPDSDGDGIPDDEDQFPDDANRATTIRIPAESFYTIAYEDLFPTKGDADFNDYVVRVVNEVDLDSSGQVTYIHGNYQHVARGAGYKHNLRLNVTSTTGGDVTVTTTGGNTNCADTSVTYHSALLEQLELFPGCDSSQTIIPTNSNGMANTNTGDVFLPGMVAHIDIKLDAPMTLQDLGGAPFDLYLYVINKKKEVHFAGSYFDVNNKDVYLDADGFPWALLIPGDWAWPLERAKIWNAYTSFDDWYLSLGQSFLDWYNSPEPAYVFTK